MNTRNGSWVSIFAFCLTAVLLASLAVAATLASIALAFGVIAPPDASASNSAQVSIESTYAGLITDSRCGAKHSPDSGQTSAECARECVRHGARYVLVNGDTTYKLIDDSGALEKMAGQRVRVAGSLDGSTLRVSSLIAAP